MAASSRSLKKTPTFNPPRLDDFVLTQKLGSGTYATVYKAYKKSGEQREVSAIKCIQKATLNRTSIENLLVEIEILKQIKHEHVVQLLDFRWDNSYIYLIMEYCGGGDLSTFIQARRILPELTVKRFLQQIASALQLLHKHNISHMDLKPQNILLTTGHHPVLKLADFGFAQYLGSNQDFALRGSPLYMAPEMILQHHYDAKVDLWSVGVILYESLFGQPPFASRSFDELTDKIKSDYAIQIPVEPSVSSSCRDLLVSLLQRDPLQRISFEDFFAHQFVDLEHKPSACCVQKATLFFTSAVEEDKKGNVADAIRLYSQAIEYFLPAIYYEQDPSRKEILRKNVKDYCERAQKLKLSLKPTTNQTERSSTQVLKELSSNNPSMLQGLEYLSVARANEESENYTAALDLYKKSLEILLPLLSEEGKSRRRDLLHQEVQISLKRAETLSSYVKVHQTEQATSRSVAEENEQQSKCSVQ
ncbi:serine/threonine-protein kinase ULK3-like isoform X3 [Clavelina lepadiformis]|uniref:serine/threonine-protein kinase ULK3-like isoform X3 n=1 Tax=Clavelina lepadiformis TaxID=159417 RepID=UPI00404320D4